MNAVEDKIDNKKIASLKFKSINALVSEIDSLPFTNRNGGDHFISNDEWMGNFRTKKDVTECLLNGWDSPLAELKKAFDSIKPNGKSFKVRSYSDVVGFVPIVPHAIMCLPNSMINQSKKINNKVISIVYNNSVNADKDQDEIVEAGKKVLIGIKEIEMQGYRVELYLGGFITKGGRDYNAVFVKLKDSNQPLDIKKMCFPLINPAMLRVIFFDAYCKGIGLYEMGRGLGQAVDSHMGKKISKRFINKNCAYMSFNEVDDAESVRDLIFDEDGKRRD